jgi:hypothetical protein
MLLTLLCFKRRVEKMETLELWDKKDYWRFQNRCVLVKEFEVPDMYPEFDPGPPEDCPFPEYWSADVEVFFIDTEEGTCKKMSFDMMKDFYKYVHGMKDRKRYWRIMKYIEYSERNK